jgi:hypothetical protein
MWQKNDSDDKPDWFSSLFCPGAGGKFCIPAKRFPLVIPHQVHFTLSILKSSPSEGRSGKTLTFC